jgi:hypothetical protein
LSGGLFADGFKCAQYKKNNHPVESTLWNLPGEQVLLKAASPNGTAQLFPDQTGYTGHYSVRNGTVAE